MKLDRKKPFGTVYGGNAGHAFEQDGHCFDHEGNLIQDKDEPVKRTGRQPKHTDDQLAEQLKG